MTIMKLLNDFLRPATLFFAILFTAFCSYAQPIQQAHRMVDRIHSQQQFHSFMQNMYMYNDAGLANHKYKFKVVMKDSTEKDVESKIYGDEKLKKSYLLKVNRNLPRKDSNRNERIYVDETISITRQDEVDKAIIMTGLATDSCWQFKVISGHISAYSFLSEKNYINSDYLAFFQVENGPIEPLIREKLEAIIKDDEKAYKVFKRKNYYKAILLYNENHH
jgi:hypothetical protein